MGWVTIGADSGPYLSADLVSRDNELPRLAQRAEFGAD